MDPKWPMFAHFCLSRLGGCNYKVKVEYKGKSIYLTDPQYYGDSKPKIYRLDASKFISGANQFRDGWCISQWNEQAERITASEVNWQT